MGDTPGQPFYLYTQGKQLGHSPGIVDLSQYPYPYNKSIVQLSPHERVS
jgi:hypothetical protein